MGPPKSVPGFRAQLCRSRRLVIPFDPVFPARRGTASRGQRHLLAGDRGRTSNGLSALDPQESVVTAVEHSIGLKPRLTQAGHSGSEITRRLLRRTVRDGARLHTAALDGIRLSAFQAIKATGRGDMPT